MNENGYADYELVKDIHYTTLTYKNKKGSLKTVKFTNLPADKQTNSVKLDGAAREMRCAAWELLKIMRESTASPNYKLHSELAFYSNLDSRKRDITKQSRPNYRKMTKTQLVSLLESL